MLSIQILEKEDLISPDDWCRPLELCTMSGGLSDGMSFRSMYSGLPENNVKWTKVKDVIGKVWFGKTVSEFCKNVVLTEFIRGDIPKQHQLDMKNFNKLRK